MTSTHTHIADFYSALLDGSIPAEIVASRIEFRPVETVTSRGKRNSWQILVTFIGPDGEEVAIEEAHLANQLEPGFKAFINVRSKLEGPDGKFGDCRSADTTVVDKGKNIGKSNETNALTQAVRDALGLYNRYVKTHQASSSKSTGAPVPKKEKSTPRDIIRPPPMLIQKEGSSKAGTLRQKDFDRGIVAQRKFNGVRLVAHWSNGVGSVAGSVDLYSGRAQNTYRGLDHIREELAPVFRDFPDLYLDGEAYLHGKSLNWISGQARREDDASSSDVLKFHVFDCFRIKPSADERPEADDTTSEDRQRILDEIFSRHEFEFVVRVDNFPVRTMGEVQDRLRRFLSEKYEGVVLRKNWETYQFSYANYHCAKVLKIKPKYDDEFPIVGFEEGKGKDKGAIIWVCEVTKRVAGDQYDPADKTFSVVPNMPLAQRKRLYACLAENEGFARSVMGKPLTVEYAEKSPKTGKPLQPKGIIIRTYEQEDDPVAKIYRSCLNG